MLYCVFSECVHISSDEEETLGMLIQYFITNYISRLAVVTSKVSLGLGGLAKSVAVIELL